MLFSVWGAAMDKLCTHVISYNYTKDSVIPVLQYVCRLLPLYLSKNVVAKIPLKHKLRNNYGVDVACTKATCFFYKNNNNTPILALDIQTVVCAVCFTFKFKCSHVCVDHNEVLPYKGDTCLSYVYNLLKKQL